MNVNDYIAGFPEDVQAVLQRLRATITEAVPDAGEALSYKIPTFTVDGRYFLYLAGFKRHVSVYPAPLTHPAFEADLAPYASGKATARFALNAPIPYDLVARIAVFKADERRKR